jgi:hypothetical protein
MAITESDSVGGALVQELSKKMLDQDEKVATTLRLKRSTLKRLKAQEQRWNTSMSLIAERALEPVLEELEKAAPPVKGGDDDG